MEKLTLENLAPYLPYGLKAELLDYKSDYVGKRFDEIIGVHQWDKNGLYWSALTIGGSKPNIERIKPILRPLSDLTKEIEHKGEKFIPYYWFVRKGIKINSIKDDRWHIGQRLLSWHFDVFRLIDKGLAIDINTLK